jgi:uncharacterized protein involved in high-affinity Fe2+ transport
VQLLARGDSLPHCLGTLDDLHKGRDRYSETLHFKAPSDVMHGTHVDEDSGCIGKCTNCRCAFLRDKGRLTLTVMR